MRMLSISSIGIINEVLITGALLDLLAITGLRLLAEGIQVYGIDNLNDTWIVKKR